MGWTGTYRPYGQSLRDFFQAEFIDNEILDFATVNRTTCYAAMRKGDEVWGLVILVTYPKNDWENIRFKYVSEEMGPVESQCPVRILDLLTPTDSKYAQEWRDRCYANARKVTPTFGDTVRFSHPITFTNGRDEDTFTVVRYGQRGKCYQSVTHGFKARISNIKSRKYEIVR